MDAAPDFCVFEGAFKSDVPLFDSFASKECAGQTEFQFGVETNPSIGYVVLLKQRSKNA